MRTGSRLLPLLLTIVAETVAVAQDLRWRALPNAPTRSGRHDDVFFIDAQVGWVVNGGGQVYATADGGQSWQLQFTAPAYCRSVGFSSSRIGWVGTLDSAHVLYRTTNGGATWLEVTNIPEPRPAGLCGISAVNNLVVYGSGRYDGPARVVKTLNRGTSWTSIDMSSFAGALVDCYFFSVDSGFVVGSTDADLGSGFTRILFTSDGGSTWTIRHTGNRAGELCWKVFFRTRTLGYVSIEDFVSGPTYYLKTTDGGVTWSDALFQNTLYDVQGIGFVGDSLGWIGGWGGNTYETTDAGASWHLAGFGYNINRFRMLSDTLGYAVGQTVYKYSTDSGTVDVLFPEPGLSLNHRLEQNYPNPFNPRTRIAYEIAKPGWVSLRVFDVLGKEVSTLVNGIRQPGGYSVTWERSGIPSGVYFYQLNVGSFSQTRKMILLR